MIDPYRMVVVNVIASCLVLFGIGLFKYIYPKRKINFFLLLLIISMLPLISLLRAGTYESGDFNIHIYRIMSFYDSLAEGNFMPSWAAELNATYGNPLFIFNYSFSYYLISIFHFSGFSFIAGMKIYLGLAFFLSGIFMYLWIKTLTNNKVASFTAAIFYLFTPYHLVDFHFRATPGESTSFALVPLLFYFVTRYFREKKSIFLISSSFFTILLFLAHPLLAFVLFGILVLYIFFWAYINKNYYLSFLNLFALVIGFIGSIHTWIPFFIYKSYMFQYPSHQLPFNDFTSLFYSPWRYGFLFQGHYGELALMIGYTQILVIIMLVLLFITKKIPSNIKLHLVFWLSMFSFFLFLMHPYSNIIWQFLPSLWMLVPFGRLLLPTAVITSVLAGYLALIFHKSKTKRKFIYLLIFFTVGYTILNWGHRRVIREIDDKVLRAGVWKSTVTEGVTAYFLNNRWADINNFWFSELPKNHLEIINGKGVVKQISRTTTVHSYIIAAETPITIKENTLYFPGWSLESNYERRTIYPGKRGVINAKLPQGLQYLELTYEDIPIYKFIKNISLGVFLSLLFILLINIFKSIFFARNPEHFSG